MKLKIKCKDCTNIYTKTTVRKNKNLLEYVNGKIWSRKIGCPFCNYKVYNKINTEALGSEFLEEYHSNRHCRKCYGKLEKKRWINCTQCKPDLGQDNFSSYIVYTNV